jgi:uncharacterized protein (UPF0332 family)
MFYAASALLADLSLSYNSHSAVISAFGREFAKTWKGNLINNAYEP